MADFKEYYSAEKIIETFLRRDFIGPVVENETISEAPLDTYAMGILYPQRTNQITKKYEDSSEIDIDETPKETGADGEAVEELDDLLNDTNGTINSANIYRPSAMAISVIVPSKSDKLSVKFSYAMYSHQESEEHYLVKIKDENGVESEEIRKKIVNLYTQHHVIIDTIEFSLSNGRMINKPLIPDNVGINLLIRKKFSDGSKLITVSAINKATSQNMEVVQNTTALFDCLLSLDCEEGFQPTEETHFIGSSIETQTLNLLYRDSHNYAVGHGCSVKWEKAEDDVPHVESAFMPKAELHQMAPAVFADLKCFLMGFLITTDRDTACNEISKMIDEYSKWVSRERNKTEEIKLFDEAVKQAFIDIECCIDRLKSGVKVLKKDDIAWQAFVYTNEVMQMQRVNYGKTKKKIVNPIDVSWYPFQLAYIIQIIPDIVDANSDWRNTVDLLWFPTGGGKTEAYLGLSAFIIFFRRLSKGVLNDGVTIIMRYTLRLLTAQQFERATSLICACEIVRKRDCISGGEISIGLWVGADLTPNKLSYANESLDKIKNGEIVYKSNPVQIFHCPYCGADIDVTNYSVSDKLVITCPNSECDFHQGLPIYVVDEDIYNEPPTLLLSTIDKFAQIVWDERTAVLFGIDGDALPPELIIQDELHLISGPLGSISGLYESAIDDLCTKNGVRPKIIASTATVCNAASQIKALYNRRHFQFPPSGVDVDNSFFAFRDVDGEKPIRQYLGICETGGSILDSLIRVYGTVFFALNYLKACGVADEIIDQYWTIVGYFNALKDLGSAATVIIDRVKTYSESLRVHKFKDDADKFNMPPIVINSFEELTSRKSSQEIKQALEDLEIKYPDERSYSYLLASNMLSVGIDISRLGLMAVYGQPKTNAEYIQATSRVGRSNPGLVIPLYNATRSRDKSHYEQFQFYHQTFYKQVEPTSVTPFSFRSLEKALHSVYVALVRQKIPVLRGNDRANLYRRNNSEVIKIKNYLLSRIKDIDSLAVDFASDFLDEFEKSWEYCAKEKMETFCYALKGKMPDTTCTLLVEAEKENTGLFPSTLNALRNVDSESNVFIIKREVN